MDAAELLAKLTGEADPYRIPRSAVESFNYIPQRRGDELTSLGVGFAKALAQGYMDGQSRNFANTQASTLSNILPELTRNPLKVERPAALDERVFNEFRTRSLQSQLLREQAQEDENRAIMNDILKGQALEGFKQQGAREIALLQASPTYRRQAISNELTGNKLQKSMGLPTIVGKANDPVDPVDPIDPIETESSAIVLEQPEVSPQRLDARRYLAGDDLGDELQVEPEVLEIDPAAPLAIPDFTKEEPLAFKKFNQLYEQQIQLSDDENIAEKMASAALNSDMSLAQEEAKSASKAAAETRALEARLRPVSAAIEKDILQGVPLQDAMTGIVQQYYNITGDEQTGQFLENRQILDGLEALSTKFFRTVGEGAITEREVAGFKAAMPSKYKTPAQNAAAYKNLMNFFGEAQAIADAKTRYLTHHKTVEGMNQALEPLQRQIIAKYGRGINEQLAEDRAAAAPAKGSFSANQLAEYLKTKGIDVNKVDLSAYR